MVGGNADALRPDVPRIAARPPGDRANRDGREIWCARFARSHPESPDDAKGLGQPARRVAAKSQRVSRPVGPPGRSDQSETSDRSRTRQTLRPDWRSRTPLPQRTRKASWIEAA